MPLELCGGFIVQPILLPMVLNVTRKMPGLFHEHYALYDRVLECFQLLRNVV